jgi:phospholipid/cholesterol/gamma-HCH transport system substrate-binding protein
MPERRERRRILLGSLLIAGIVAAAVLIFFLDAVVGVLERRVHIVATLPDAPRVTTGSPVWIAGKRVGTVSAIAFRERIDDPEARVAITLEIPRRLRDQLSAGSHVRLTSARMIGEPVIDIVPGPAGAPLLPAGDTLFGGQAYELGDVIDRLRVARAAFTRLGAEFAALSASPALRGGRLDAVQRRFAAVGLELEGLRAATGRGTLGRLLADPALGASIDALSARVTQLRTVLGDRVGERSAELTDLRSAFDRLASDADSVAGGIARVQAAADAAAGTLPRFAADSAVTVALRRVRAQLDSLIQEVRSNPLRFVF